MQVPRLFATGLWLAVTTAATAMVWTATSIVAADVTDRPAPVVAHRDVVSQLASGAAGGPTSATPKPPAPAPTAAPRDRQPASPTTSVPAAPASPARPSATTTPPAPPTTAPPPPTTRPATPPTTVASAQTATYSTTGGVVAVSCSGFFITLLSAIPSNGFATNVVARGPANVDVHFVGPGQDFAVKVVCFGHPIRYSDQLPAGPAFGSP